MRSPKAERKRVDGSGLCGIGVLGCPESVPEPVPSSEEKPEKREFPLGFPSGRSKRLFTFSPPSPGPPPPATGKWSLSSFGTSGSPSVPPGWERFEGSEGRGDSAGLEEPLPDDPPLAPPLAALPAELPPCPKASAKIPKSKPEASRSPPPIHIFLLVQNPGTSTIREWSSSSSVVRKVPGASGSPK